MLIIKMQKSKIKNQNEKEECKKNSFYPFCILHFHFSFCILNFEFKILKHFFCLILFLFLPLISLARIELGVAPQKLDLVILPGDIYKGQFKIANFSEISLPLSIKIVPFGAEDETGKTIFQEITPDSPVFWFEFEKKEMILEPGETKRINFQIKIPKDVNPGGYYVFIYFEPRYPPDYLMKIGPKVVPMIGVPVLISTTLLALESPETGKELEVVEFSVLEKERAKNLEKTLSFISKGLASIGRVEAAKNPEITITKTKPSFFNVKIKNNDIYHIKPFGTLLLYNVFGKEIAKADFLGQTILPGKTMVFQIKLENKNQGFQIPLSDLKLKAEFNLRAQSPVRGEIVLKEKISTLSLFSLSSIYFLIAFAIILILGWLMRKRLKAAVMVLIGRK